MKAKSVTIEMTEKIKRKLHDRLDDMGHAGARAIYWKGFTDRHDMSWDAIKLLQSALKNEHNGVCQIEGRLIRQALHKVGI